MKTYASICWTLLAGVALAAPQKRATTTVDLGFGSYVAAVNETGEYYVFSDIPYAQQPIGDLRFQKPVVMTSDDTAATSTSTSIECMQAYPEWIIELQAESYGVDTTTMEYLLYNTGNQTESCLVLDVYVPISIYEAGASAEAPVIFWIHGGGFAYGSKTGSGKVAGLLARANQSAIIVSINYRLGMFGWLAGSDVTPNLGFYDQLAALEWVQSYISYFGGSPDKITAVGESAGASSLLHHLTAYGGTATTAFNQAVIMSPAFQFTLNGTYGYELTMEVASNITGETISSVSDLTALSSDVLKEVNQETVQPALVGLFNYGPVVDGTYVTEVPQALLYQGKFASDVSLFLSHTSNESVPFTSSSITTAADLRTTVESMFPAASNDTINTMLDDVWPDVLDGTYPWETEFARAVRLGAEAFFTCSTRYLATALGNNSYNSLFAYPPGYHAQDVAFLFFNGDVSTLVDGVAVSREIAYAIQDHVVSFAVSGDPNYDGASVTWPVYGSSAQVLEYGYSGISVATDDTDNSRCTWIQQAIVDGLLVNGKPGDKGNMGGGGGRGGGQGRSMGPGGRPPAWVKGLYLGVDIK